MIKLVLIFDQLDWATGSEALALKKHLDWNAPGQFAVTLCASGQSGQIRPGQFDILLSGLYYALRDAQHPKSISMISSESYWIRKSWTAEQNTETGVAGWPHLHNWQYMVAHNKEIYEKLTPEDHPKIKLLYHTLDHEFWTPGLRQAHSGKFRVGFAGHEQDIKGWDILVGIKAAMPNIDVVAATYENNRKPAAEMPDFYRSLDAYLCLSRWDCGPRPPMEAGLCGTPVITTRTGQIQEMVVDGETGLFIEPSVQSACDAINRLRVDTALRSKLGMQAREEFSSKWAVQGGRDWTQYLLDVHAGRI